MYTEGIKVQLTTEKIKEAIDWGGENRDSPEKMDSHYRFGESEDYREYGYILTKFYSLAYLSYKAVSLNEPLDQAEIDRILGEKALKIAIHTYGNGKDFAKNYRIVLK